ncbi:DUF3618 domain-containing protein [Sedimentitalea sp. XS_ASV28]|uniref:DUF3618 domain-containing protein n=1 Tax=Sedimentitalea sp. XS_ASV28 TaxID=3241296 RepID=UPI00351890A8
MTSETRSVKQIEREIEDHRSDLASNLNELQSKFSVEELVRQVGDRFREHGGDMGRSISEQVKANPIPLALTGIGLTWLMFGSAQRPAPEFQSRDRYRDGHDVQGRLEHNMSQPGFREPSWSREDYDPSPIGQDYTGGTGTGTDAPTGMVQSAKDRVAGAGSSIRETAASAKSGVARTADAARSGLSNMGQRISEGTENLTEEGRQRVIAARRKAIDMRRSVARSVGDGTEAVADFYERQPLVIGALALAFGAAVAGALPRTGREDRLMGARSDSLFDEAERIFDEEKKKVASVVASVKEEAQDIAAETKAELESSDPSDPDDKSAVQAAGDKAKEAVKRVADKAKSEAENQSLGTNSRK